jgi:hypothetical protein
MAGAGYKLFNTGDVLLASEVNTYLQQQVTMVFANATARTSALSGVLAEGMMSYLQDTNTVEVYNGTSWVNVGNAGDITEVQAGTGISVASGTGPIPVITNTVATTFDAAGDLVYGTGSDTFTKLSLGTAGQVLTVNSGATAPEWKTAAGGGKILQVVEGSTTTQTTINTGTFTDTGITATITPSSATSKILVIVSASVLTYATSGTTMLAETQLLRGATQIADLNTFLRFSQPSSFSDNSIGINGAITKLDSPNTTSATTYKVQAKQGGGTIYFNHGSNRSTIILMEVGA